VFVLAFVSVFFSFPKNLDFSNTSLSRQAGIEEESLMISAALPLDLPKVKAELIFGVFSIKLLATLDLNELMSLSVVSESHLAF